MVYCIGWVVGMPWLLLLAVVMLAVLLMMMNTVRDVRAVARLTSNTVSYHRVLYGALSSDMPEQVVPGCELEQGALHSIT